MSGLPAAAPAAAAPTSSDPTAATSPEAPPAETLGDGVLRHCRIGDLALECGEVLPDAVLAYETWGALAEDGSNAVLVLHALTGDAHVAHGDPGPELSEQERAAAEAEGWWEGLVGPGAVVDTEKYFVVCPNILGGSGGSTGPASPAPDGRPWGSRFPLVSLRDAAAAEARLADALGVESWHTVLGGSLGGCRAVEWAVSFPDRVEHCVVVAANAHTTAEQLAWSQAQALAVRQDPDFAGGDYYGQSFPAAGLGLARRIAHITYRSATELHYRFGRHAQNAEDPTGPTGAARGRYRVESYLDHHAQKLAVRFDANAYLAVNEALMSHDVGRGRGGQRAALARSRCAWTVVAVDSDRLFYPKEAEQLAASLPEPVPVQVMSSPNGHDGFLLETSQLARILREGPFARRSGAPGPAATTA